MKSPPLQKIERAIETAAYEHEEEAAPSSKARMIAAGESSGSSR